MAPQVDKPSSDALWENFEFLSVEFMNESAQCKLFSYAITWHAFPSPVTHSNQPEVFYWLNESQCLNGCWTGTGVAVLLHNISDSKISGRLSKHSHI